MDDSQMHILKAILYELEKKKKKKKRIKSIV